MKLSDLKNGAVVEARDGCRYIKIDNTFLDLDMNGGSIYWPDFYNEELYCINNTNYDIMKVAMAKGSSKYPNLSLCDALDGEWTWVREEPILTEQEKEYLANVIKPFKEKIVAIRKIKYGDLSYEADWVEIVCKSVITGKLQDIIELPLFEKNSMYKGMKYNYDYKLEQLGLN